MALCTNLRALKQPALPNLSIKPKNKTAGSGPIITTLTAAFAGDEWNPNSSSEDTKVAYSNDKLLPPAAAFSAASTAAADDTFSPTINQRCCFCDQLPEGTMILCDGAHCSYKWLHARCLRWSKRAIKRQRQREKDWFCEECAEAAKMRQGGLGKIYRQKMQAERWGNDEGLLDVRVEKRCREQRAGNVCGWLLCMPK